ncbi:MAG: CoA-binding protein [Fimbriimonadales bacterium]|nr:MAG: CoA-binding protein [Fimbriimonadales bacterium]
MWGIIASVETLACAIRLNTVLPPELQARYQNSDVIRRVLREARTIAIVGASTDSYKASHMVMSYLRSEGYRCVPVNPKAGTILGERCYPDLLSIPEPIDVVDIFRPASECPAIVEQALQIGAKCVWFQLRIVHLEAAKRAEQAGLTVIVDRCLKMEHGRYAGSLHWVGMNTEIITARKMQRWF